MTPKEVMEHFGTADRAAAKLSVSIYTVYQWNRRRYIPHGRQALIQLATRGKLRAEEKETT